MVSFNTKKYFRRWKNHIEQHKSKLPSSQEKFENPKEGLFKNYSKEKGD